MSGMMLGFLADEPLNWWQGLLLACPIVGLSLWACHRRPRLAWFKRAVLWAGLGLPAACVALGLADIRLLKNLARENHELEWLTAFCLLVAWTLGLVMSVRRHRAGAPSPWTVFLTAGCFWAFWRELEYGAAFAEHQFFYGRNLFRPRSFIGPAYFEQFRQAMEIPMEASRLYAIHLAFTAVFVVVVGAAAWYILRHRDTFLEEGRLFPRTANGRYFLIGVGAYVVAQVVGKILHKILALPALVYWRKTVGISHRLFDEPVELWGAACVAVSMIVLWKVSRRYVRLIRFGVDLGPVLPARSLSLS